MLQIAGRPIGDGHPCYIVAEAGVNHDNSPDTARDLVAGAQGFGADAIKFQSYTASKLAAAESPLYWKGEAKSQRAVFEGLDKLPIEVLGEIIEETDFPVFSTPFDLEAVDDLDRFGVPCFKIASADITYHDLIRHVASKGKPVIISTGASMLSEVAAAVEVCRKEGNEQLVLLQCTLKYPCPPSSINLKAMQTLRQEFGFPVGLSDHSIGIAVPLAAAALGACMLEKHFTLAKETKGSPDHWLSADRLDLSRIVRGVRDAEAALGCALKLPDPIEAEAQLYARRSVTSAKDIPVGATLTPDMLTCKRPATGIPADRMGTLYGARARWPIPDDTTIDWSMIG